MNQHAHYQLVQQHLDGHDPHYDPAQLAAGFAPVLTAMRQNPPHYWHRKRALLQAYKDLPEDKQFRFKNVLTAGLVILLAYDHNLTPHHINIIRCLASIQPCTHRLITAYSGQDRSNTHKRLRYLLDRGIILRDPNTYPMTYTLPDHYLPSLIVEYGAILLPPNPFANRTHRNASGDIIHPDALTSMVFNLNLTADQARIIFNALS